MTSSAPFNKTEHETKAYMTYFRIIPLLCMAAGAVSFNAAHAQAPAKDSDWTVSAGVGIASVPAGIGAQKRKTRLLPAVDVRHRSGFFANVQDGAGFETRLDALTLSAALGVDFYERDPKNNRLLAGAKKVGLAPAARFKAEYALNDFTVSGTLASRLGDAAKRGNTLQLEAAYALLTSKTVLASVGVNATLADAKFARNLLSVNAADAAATGLRRFDAGSGLFESGVFTQGLYRIDADWTLFSRLQFTCLHGDAAKAPFVQKKNATTFALFTTYTF
jgi:MipA family protein